MTFHVRTLTSITQISNNSWNQVLLTGQESAPATQQVVTPFMRHEFLSSLEEAGCVGPDTGWQPCHIVVEDDENQLVAIVVGYLKSHSYGEYVFDHGWANAYHQHGLDYYPKWISAIPFTPVTNSKMVCRYPNQQDEIYALIKNELLSLQAQLNLSSVHWLFVDSMTSDTLSKQHFLPRYSVQFEWFNYGYLDYQAFLQALTSRKRKTTKKASEKLQRAGIIIERKCHQDINSDDWEFFYQCYRMTYLKRSGHEGYLTKDFFTLLLERMREHILLVIAYKGTTPIASALFLYDSSALYGRYWGALEEVDGLHFECCYQQGIMFAIENKIARFNPGTQGEHKILRGFEPTYCRSYHQLKDPDFHRAVEDFLIREKQHMLHYFSQTCDLLPFNDDFLTEYVSKRTQLLAPDNES